MNQYSLRNENGTELGLFKGINLNTYNGVVSVIEEESDKFMGSNKISTVINMKPGWYITKK